MEEWTEDTNEVLATELRKHFPTEFRKILGEKLTDEEFESKVWTLFNKIPKH